ncbi:MAG: HAMP domain-containing sensor histidine kinase, partial [Candidatus Margulisbacteria bacterium]|nr:HAMP domain-containing sensor histidine kinase [Candidatus Margulisiibacteriota bacterium]
AIVQAILDLTRNNAADSFYSVNKTLVGLKALWEGDIRSKGIDLELQLDEQDPTLFGSKQKFIEIMMNLVKNACDAVAAGGKIIVATKKTEDGALTAVSDNGSGIRAEVLPKIFQPYFTTKSEDNGTGLGLYIVKDSVERMGGRIEILTKPGRGTTFTIYLPNKSPEAKAE